MKLYSKSSVRSLVEPSTSGDLAVHAIAKATFDTRDIER
jgi:hypothetical protein